MSGKTKQQFSCLSGCGIWIRDENDIGVFRCGDIFKGEVQLHGKN